MASRRTRAEVRADRYRYLRNLKFTSSEARKLRDQSATKIQETINRRQRQISKKPIARRTSEEKEQLQVIRVTKKQEKAKPTEQPQIIQTRLQRLEQFKEWSRARKFPPGIQRFISALNTDAGRDPFDSYGYRVFYWRYVFGMPEVQAIRRVETRDT